MRDFKPHLASQPPVTTQVSAVLGLQQNGKSMKQSPKIVCTKMTRVA
jgi:hypothetical protein